MFADLFHIVRSLEHDYRDEGGKQVHDVGCRRCQLTVRLNHFKIQIVQILRDIEFSIGEAIEKNKRP
jgi:hypothetical protein